MMSTVKMGADSDLMGGNPSEITQRMLEDMPFKMLHQGVSADMIAKRYSISREDCDKLAVTSHTRAAKARDAGLFDAQIMPIKRTGKDGKEVVLTKDEGIRFPVDVAKVRRRFTRTRKSWFLALGFVCM